MVTTIDFMDGTPFKLVGAYSFVLLFSSGNSTGSISPHKSIHHPWYIPISAGRDDTVFQEIPMRQSVISADVSPLLMMSHLVSIEHIRLEGARINFNSKTSILALCHAPLELPTINDSQKPTYQSHPSSPAMLQLGHSLRDFDRRLMQILGYCAIRHD